MMLLSKRVVGGRGTGGFPLWRFNGGGALGGSNDQNNINAPLIQIVLSL